MESSSNKLRLLLTTTVALLLLLLVSVGVRAGIDCNLTSISTINRQTALNASFNVSGDGSTGLVGVAFELRDTSNHINSSFSVIGNITNTSGLRYANLTFGDSIVFPDADSADLRATCYLNATGAVDVTTSTSVTGITVDRTNPVTQGLSSPVSGVSSNLYTVTFGVVNTSRWRLFHNSVVAQTTAVTSNIVNSSQQSFQISLRDSGSYYVETNDGTNTTNSETVSYTLAGKLIKSKVDETTKKVIQDKKIIKERKSNKGFFLIAVVIIIFVVIVAIMATPRIKRKRK